MIEPYAPESGRRGQQPFAVQALVEKAEQIKASIRPKMAHPSRALKRQFGYDKVRCRELKKNTLQIITLLALGNLRIARHKLQALAQVRPQQA